MFRLCPLILTLLPQFRHQRGDRQHPFLLSCLKSKDNSEDLQQHIPSESLLLARFSPSPVTGKENGIESTGLLVKIEFLGLGQLKASVKPSISSKAGSGRKVCVQPTTVAVQRWWVLTLLRKVGTACYTEGFSWALKGALELNSCSFSLSLQPKLLLLK